MKARKNLSKKDAQEQFLALLEGIVHDFPAHRDNPLVGVAPTLLLLSPLAKFARRNIEPFLRGVSRTLFRFFWTSLPGASSNLHIGAIDLPEGTTAYWIYDDNLDWDEQHFVVGTAAKGLEDLDFLKLLFAYNGRDFGYELFGAPPSEIDACISSPSDLADLFLAAYKASPTAWDSLLDNSPADAEELDSSDPSQARELVARHLREVAL
jgi:hypothetical protein